MREPRRRDPAVQLVVGLAIVLAGVLFTLDNLHVLRAGDYLRYWPVVLVAIGAAQIAHARTASRMWGGSVWIVLGTLLLADRLGLFQLRVWALWPLLLVIVGARIFWQAFSGQVPPPPSPPPKPVYADGSATVKDGVRHLVSSSDESVVTATALLGSFERRVGSQAFRRAELTAMMGGGKLDLVRAVPAPEGAVVDVFAFMGGLEVIVPESWRVSVELTPFMGHCENKAGIPEGDAKPQLTVRGFLMMGGVDIKTAS